jgi:hypothetical protein
MLDEMMQQDGKSNDLMDADNDGSIVDDLGGLFKDSMKK